MPLNAAQVDTVVAEAWSDSITPALVDYVAIPALSPSFDPDWAETGHIGEAIGLIRGWIEAQDVAGMEVSLEEIEGRTPVLLVEIEAFGSPPGDETVLLYGHLDKQPEMTGWRDDLGPWKPVIEGTRLYGRGGADDGYAAFASLTAIRAVQESGGSHSRCVILIEASEESGSPDLPAHIDALGDRLGDVALVICLDSGCATFDTMWLTTSLRGLVDGTIQVDVVSEGLHSGVASGVVPSSFRIMREILDRLEDSSTGEVLLSEASVEIPQYRIDEAASVVEKYGDLAIDPFPLIGELQLMAGNTTDALIARTWAPALSVTGADGLPPTGGAGNVLRPSTSLKVSIRLAPTADQDRVREQFVQAITSDPPSGATVTLSDIESAPGWNAPDLAPWLARALAEASEGAFGQTHQMFGEGGSIPFMGLLGEKFPDAQFVITGVLGPESNAHGPNEFLELAYAEKLTAAMAHVLDAQGRK